MSSHSHLRAGQVVRIRVNPTDCLSVLDLMQAVGIKTTGMSFSQCASLALSSLLHTARHSKILPEPDGFDYLQRMQPFAQGNISQKAKLEMTNRIHAQGATFQAPSLPEIIRGEHSPEAYEEPVEVVTPELRRARTRLGELCAKRELAEGNRDVMWTGEDQMEYEKNFAVVYPGENLL
jgi:hypothetical protein